MAQEEKSESVEVVLERARDLLAAEVERSSYQSVADRVGVSKPTLYGFLNGASTPKGERRRKILKYAKRRGQERSGSVPRETKRPATEAGISDAGLGAFWALRSVYAHVLETMDTVLTGEFDRRFGAPPQPIPHGEAERLARAQAALDVHQRNTEAKAARKAPARKRHTAG